MNMAIVRSVFFLKANRIEAFHMLCLSNQWLNPLNMFCLNCQWVNTFNGSTETESKRLKLISVGFALNFVWHEKTLFGGKLLARFIPTEHFDFSTRYFNDVVGCWWRYEFIFPLHWFVYISFNHTTYNSNNNNNDKYHMYGVMSIKNDINVCAYAINIRVEYL